LPLERHASSSTRYLAEFGPWQTVWKRHHRFSTDGTWDKVLTALQAQADARPHIGPTTESGDPAVAGQESVDELGAGRYP